MRLWRALVRITSIKGDVVRFVVPGMGYKRIWKLDKACFPPSYQNEIDAGYRFHCKLDLNATKSKDLNLSEFEPDLTSPEEENKGKT